MRKVPFPYGRYLPTKFQDSTSIMYRYMVQKLCYRRMDRQGKLKMSPPVLEGRHNNTLNNLVYRRRWVRDIGTGVFQVQV